MALNTFTQIQDDEGHNRTATHLSTNIVIVVNGNVVGAVQEFSVEESREIKEIDELGTDGHIDSSPTRSTEISGTCKRIRWDKMRIAQAFSRDYVHLHSQRVPFDIEIHDFFHDANRENEIITIIENVWMNSISYSYSSSDFIITESMNWKAEGIHSIIKSGQNVVQGPGTGYGPIFVNTIEQQADMGKYRGSLTAPGLLTAWNNT